jgi:hypothetical protein
MKKKFFLNKQKKIQIKKLKNQKNNWYYATQNS